MLPERAPKSTSFTLGCDRNSEFAAYYREIAANGSKILVLSAVGNFLLRNVSASSGTGRSGCKGMRGKALLVLGYIMVT